MVGQNQFDHCVVQGDGWQCTRQVSPFDHPRFVVGKKCIQALIRVRTRPSTSPNSPQWYSSWASRMLAWIVPILAVHGVQGPRGSLHTRCPPREHDLRFATAGKDDAPPGHVSCATSSAVRLNMRMYSLQVRPVKMILSSFNPPLIDDHLSLCSLESAAVSGQCLAVMA